MTQMATLFSFLTPKDCDRLWRNGLMRKEGIPACDLSSKYCYKEFVYFDGTLLQVLRSIQEMEQNTDMKHDRTESEIWPTVNLNSSLENEKKRTITQTFEQFQTPQFKKSVCRTKQIEVDSPDAVTDFPLLVNDIACIEKQVFDDNGKRTRTKESNATTRKVKFQHAKDESCYQSETKRARMTCDGAHRDETNCKDSSSIAFLKILQCRYSYLSQVVGKTTKQAQNLWKRIFQLSINILSDFISRSDHEMVELWDQDFEKKRKGESLATTTSDKNGPKITTSPEKEQDKLKVSTYVYIKKRL
uniref:AlNc14C38G3327 protein n=1 Tax=Albugo laibachii Nc14 TaxID=890382 RepID=F0W960_9STRA|nr:AlNc14C38G3327 [Albugo laibachii Nc14]|eukprot:CCA17673.1 AlNc14C38G3327 [Albugo laibachii Nc14]